MNSLAGEMIRNGVLVSVIGPWTSAGPRRGQPRYSSRARWLESKQ